MKTYLRKATRQPLFEAPDGWRPGAPLALATPKPPAASDTPWRLVSVMPFREKEWAEQELVCYWEREL